jgi:hypothetical protein
MYKTLLALCIILISACADDNTQPSNMDPIAASKSKSDWSQTEDSLKIEIAIRDSIIRELSMPNANFSSSSNLDQFCLDIAKELVDAINSRDEDKFISHFSEAYSVNWVDVREQAQIGRYTHLDFPKEFKKIIRADKKNELKINKYELLSTDLKSDLFNATFKVYIQEKDDGNVKKIRKATFSIVGRKEVDYKIANMNVYVF